ncbi:MAG: motility protein A [Chloroflexota bacterium]
MKSNALIGIIIGLAAIFGAFLLEGGAFEALFLVPPLLIVFGGTFAAGLAGSSLKAFKNIPRVLRVAFGKNDHNVKEIINQIVIFSIKTRREGILTLENEMRRAKHPYLKRMMQISIDGASSDTLRDIIELEMQHIAERHNENAALFTKMGGYAPTMGIIGTVMGLISTLASAGSDPNVLIHHIASAFIATLWGILSANIIWLPLADRLKTLHRAEMSLISMMLTGVEGILIGETPSVVKARLASVFPLREQEKLMGEKKQKQQEEPAASVAAVVLNASEVTTPVKGKEISTSKPQNGPNKS